MAIAAIVVGIDGSESSLNALAFTIGLASREHAILNACFVSHQIMAIGVGVVPMDFDAYSKELEQTVREETDRAGIQACFFHRKGDIVAQLKILADDTKANLIAVGRSKHPFLHVGCVPKRLLDDARHAVLIVP